MGLLGKIWARLSKRSERARTGGDARHDCASVRPSPPRCRSR
jgi:hypothetical protein